MNAADFLLRRSFVALFFHIQGFAPSLTRFIARLNGLFNGKSVYHVGTAERQSKKEKRSVCPLATERIIP